MIKFIREEDLSTQAQAEADTKMCRPISPADIESRRIARQKQEELNQCEVFLASLESFVKNTSHKILFPQTTEEMPEREWIGHGLSVNPIPPIQRNAINSGIDLTQMVGIIRCKILALEKSLENKE